MKTLNDEIFISDDGYHPEEEVLLVSDVKKFINKTLKDIRNKKKHGHYSAFFMNSIEEIFKQNFGDALSEEKENNSQQVNTEDKSNTSPSLPLRKKDESLEGGCNEDLLAPADTNLSEKAEVKK